jgi:hypothetical protein
VGAKLQLGKRNVAAGSAGFCAKQSFAPRRVPKQELGSRRIKLIHALLEDTVSVFKEFEIKDGVMVRKTTP